MILTDRETDIILLALRILQRDTKSVGEHDMAAIGYYILGDDMPAMPHLDEVEELCEKINTASEQRVTVEVCGGIAEFTEVPPGITTRLIDWDRLESGACPYCDVLLDEDGKCPTCGRVKGKSPETSEPGDGQNGPEHK